MGRRGSEDAPETAARASRLATRGALRGGLASGAERIAIGRRLGQLDIPGDSDGGGGGGEDRHERGLPAGSYA